MASHLISADEKRLALERVLASHTFSRSDQLRSFLRYVCEAEFEGRAQELNEYVLGVSVLGRPSGYSPAEDSCVRTRAYELRNKLKSYYQLEAPADPVRIEIRKGAYVPQFERVPEIVPAHPPAGTEPVAPEAVRVAPVDPDPPKGEPDSSTPARTPAVLRVTPGRLFAAAALIALLALPGLYAFWSRQPAKGPEPQTWTTEMIAFWKPFLSDSTPLIVSFEIRLFFFSPSTGLVVRDFQTNQPDDLSKSSPLSDFRKRMGAPDLQETSDYADFGSVHAAYLLGRLLGSQRRAVGLKHSGSLGWEDLWNSNVIFIGKPNLNPAIRYALKSDDFSDDDLGVIRNLHPAAGEAREYRSATTHGAGVKYALITRLPGPQPGRDVMILSGAGAELMWALAEFVTDSTHVQELVGRLRTPSGQLPRAFQAVIQATFESNVPIKLRYITHRVSKSS